MIPRELILRTISILEREATELFETETVHGDWSHAVPGIKEMYDEMISLALEYRRLIGESQ